MLIEVSNEWYEQQQEVWRGVTIIKLHYNQITILANSYSMLVRYLHGHRS